jgi:hypothetical protein
MGRDMGYFWRWFFSFFQKTKNMDGEGIWATLGDALINPLSLSFALYGTVAL